MLFAQALEWTPKDGGETQAAAPTSPIPTLPDGSAPEGVDPSPPLKWTRESLMASKFTLYGVAGSPPTAKIMFYMEHFGAFPTAYGRRCSKAVHLARHGHTLSASAYTHE